MTLADDEQDPVDAIAQEFATRLRRGEQPTIAEYRQRYPELIEAIDELFPTLEMMETLKPPTATSASGGPVDGGLAVDQLGDYRIEREIGRGGMGIVYEAVQESLERRVALKVLPTSALFSPDKIERFHREARAAAQLHHTNIVPVYGVGEEAGTHYFVMQYIEGAGVDTILRDLRTADSLPDCFPGIEGSDYVHAVAGIGEQVASALAHAHAHGTLHRDIKPGNLILDHEGNVWVADFGLAKLDEADDLTQTGGVMGTLRYTAPEQLDGVSSKLSDIYALGITLYELLALTPAFPESDRRQLLQRILHESPPPLRRVRPEIAPDLETVIHRAIDKDPNRRYPTAAAFAEDLARFRQGVPVRARRIGSIERFSRWCSRNRGLAASSFAAVLALIAATVVGWIGYAETNAALRRESANVELSLAALEEIFDSLANQETTREQRAPRSRGPIEHELGESEAEVLSSILRFFDRFAAQNETNARLQLEAAKGYRRVGVILDRSGDSAAAATHIARSLVLFERLRSKQTTYACELETAESLTAAAKLSLDSEDAGTATTHLDHALRCVQSAATLAADGAPDDPRVGSLRARICQLRGTRCRLADDTEGAIRELERALDWIEVSDDRLSRRDRAAIVLDLARVYCDRERFTDAIAMLDRTVPRPGRPGRLPRTLEAELHGVFARALAGDGDDRAAAHHRRIAREIEEGGRARRNGPGPRERRPGY